MVEHYHSFLLRYWRRIDGSRRLTIEHIPTGQRALVTTLAAALAWLEACCATPTTDDQLGRAAGADDAPTPGPGAEGQSSATRAERW